MLPLIKNHRHPEILKVVEKITTIRASLRGKEIGEESIKYLIEEMMEINKQDPNLAFIFAVCETSLNPCTDFTFGALLMYNLLREQDIINQCAELESLLGVGK